MFNGRNVIVEEIRNTGIWLKDVDTAERVWLSWYCLTQLESMRPPTAATGGAERGPLSFSRFTLVAVFIFVIAFVLGAGLGTVLWEGFGR